MALLWLVCCVSEPETEALEVPIPVEEAAPEAARDLRLDPPKNAILIVIDTLRADALAEARTPHIDALGEQRAVRAWSGGTWTVPSVVSLFTGAPVRSHGFDLPTGKLGRYPRLPDLPVLAEVLAAEGFRTDGLYSNGYLAEELGFDRGFDRWRRVTDKVLAKEFHETVAKQWTEDGRHFAYLHFLGPHSPLKPSEETRAHYEVDAALVEGRMGLEIGAAKRNEPGARLAYQKAYRAVIEDTDARIAQVVEALGEHRDDTLIVLTSDHGELLGEHDVVGHGYWVWEPLTNVPFLVSGARTEVPDFVSNVGTAQLICDELAVAHSFDVDLSDRPVVSQREGKLALSVDGRHKAIWDGTPRGVEGFFDLEVDPGELTVLADSHGLTQVRDAWQTTTPAGPVLEEQVELSEETTEQLEKLGYLE